MKEILTDTKGLTIFELIVVIIVFSLIFSAGTLVFGDVFG
jgi:prepilin-type N-terminal cleavage/methylation domain-containing protein